MKVESGRLLRQVSALAAAALLARYWAVGKRHDISLALSGALLRKGWLKNKVEHFVCCVARAGGDDEVDDRREAVHTTAEKLKKDQNCSGLPTLRNLLPAAVVDSVAEWLSLSNGTEAPESVVDTKSSVTKHIFTTYSDFMSQVTADDEVIALEACRGEVVLVQSVTNKGKSTLMRNIAFCLATGRQFEPFVSGDTARRVLLVNLEGSCGRFQADLRVMERVFDDVGKKSIHDNFFPTHAPELDDEPLSLSQHVKIFAAQAKVLKPDVIIIDTVTAAFSIRNESDNSEVVKLMKVLIKLARYLNCVIVIVHHIGKAKAEGGETREAAHRGRGASAWADCSAAIFNLEHDQTTDTVTLTCAKRKTGTGQNYEMALRLDREGRWFSATNDAPPRTEHTDSDKSLTTSGLEQLLEGKMSVKTIGNQLRELVKNGLATQPKWGRYQVRIREQNDSASSATAIGDYRIAEQDNTKRDSDLEFGKLGNPLYDMPELPNSESVSAAANSDDALKDVIGEDATHP
jgi:ABC-type lipoprotein export system ATPase subunit